MKNIFLLIMCYLPFLSFSQEKKAGEFELGLRNTLSLFSADNNSGFGAGGQFRLRLANQLNTEWYADLIKNNIDDLGSRTDSHIGWSVMFYPKWYDTKITPYFIAGHCFDYTKVVAFANYSSIYGEQELKSVSRLSSAVQAGIGTSLAVSDRVNISLAGQYMMHLGNDVHAHIDEHELHIEKVPHTGVEGHLLVTLSMNVLIADLW